jgi:hypothetical protein
MGILFCCVSFAACLLLGRVSIAAGLGSVVSVGYLYGIIRANYLDSATYFVFDSATVGFYLSLLSGLPSRAHDDALRPLRGWTMALLGWTVFMFLMPIQHPLIQLVGLRGNAFLLPLLLMGGWLRWQDARQLSLWLAVLNHIAFAFALAEYVIGVPAFFPRNQVTELIYRSTDVAGTAFRIPACFANAHSYGGTMVATLPWLIGAWTQPRLPGWHRALLGSGIALALAGVFMSAARSIMIQLAVVILLTTLSGKLRGGLLFGWLIVLGVVGYVVSGEERLQRFLTLGDTEHVMTRLEGSVNLNFVELLVAYPLGNGMGAGGTSIPYFLQHLLRDPVGLENEYSRILLEQGVPGLLLWLAFIVWCIGQRPNDPRDAWLFGKRLLWAFGLASFATAAIGIGLMTAIPQSALFLLGMGFALTAERTPRRSARRRHATQRATTVPPAPVMSIVHE